MVLLFTGLFNGCAQNTDYIFRHITINEGMISNKVTTLYQDKEGFMWIGTQTGLQRYDGTRFKNYLADIKDTAALQSDWISSIFEDSKNRLWIGSDLEGPYTLNRATEKFYNYNLHTPAKNKINGIWHFTEDKQGNIWIAGHDGLYKLNEVINQFEKYNSRLGFDKNSNTGFLAIDSENNFWIGTTSGIKFYNQQQKKLYGNNYNPFHNPVFDIKESIGFILMKADELWVTCSRKIYKYNFSTNKIQAFSFDKLTRKKNGPADQKEIIGGLYCLQDGKVIVPLAGRGLAIYQPDINKFFFVEADNTKAFTYHINENNNSNICIAQDRAKNTFIGSDKGINIYNTDKQFFQTHSPGIEKNNLFPKEPVNDFLQLQDGNILISYYSINGGIVKMDSNFNFKKQYLLKTRENKNSGSNQIWNLFKDEKGIIWAPTQNKTILKLNLLNNKLTEQKDSVLSGQVNIIKQDSAGNIWMGHWKKGLVKIDAVTHKKYFYSQFIFSDSTNKKRVQCILLDGNRIWAGTPQNGLQLFDKKEEKFIEAYVINTKNKTSISNNCVTDILQYNRDTLIIATLMGVNIFDRKNKTFKAITSREGLPNNLVQTIMKDSQGNVWVACYDNGLCKINMQNLSVINYDVNDGNTDNIFTSKFLQLKNGKVLIGASGSFISFNPSLIAAIAPPAGVCITGVHIFEKEIIFDSLLLTHQPLKLSYKENSLRIEFASVEFWNPGSVQYFYKLNGVDKDWIKADKSQAAVYNQLNDGNYIFEVKCAGREGISCKEITMFKIIICPPFWKTWWFIFLVTAAIIFSLYNFIKWREKNIKTINATKLKVQQLNAEQYKSKLELEQIINYFSSSLIDKNTVDDVLWDVTKNLIGRLGFEDCILYLWNSDKTKMIQRAGHGPKGSIEDIENLRFDVSPGQGVVGHVMQTKEPVLIPDTSKDARYRVDDIERLSEITVPVIYNNELIGVIDSEHQLKNFFTPQHLQVLNTIATLMANKIKSIESEQDLQQTKIEILGINEKLSEAKLEALRSQMNPHFIFNSLNAIQECILTNKVDAAYKYLSKFSKLQRMVLNNSAKEFISLSSELEMLRLYLSLESLRFSQSFTYSIEIKKEADADEIRVPSMIIQPYVENALWHGLRNKTGEKTLTITCEENAGELTVTIDDNGIGRTQAAAIKAQKLGAAEPKGTVLSAQRISILSLKYNASIFIEVIDKTGDNNQPAGTTVIIKLPSDIETTKP
ncbi:MAG: histidine kinase [Ferruginibacter sp.]|nr:histidine kinase [Ferruginibacter sp.]